MRFFLLLLLIAFIPCLVSAANECISPYVSSTIYSGIVGWYRMDEGIGTVTYNTMNMTGDVALMSTNTGQPGWAQTSANIWNTTHGKVNNSMMVTSASGIWIKPGSIPLGFTSGDLSLSLWYISSGLSTFGWMINLGMEGYGDPQMRVFYNTGFLYLCVGPWSTGIISVLRTGALLANGVWHHVVATRTGTTYRLYHDSSLIGTATSATVFSAYDDGIRIGRGPGGGANDISQMDEFMMWNRAISAQEVFTLYNPVYSPGFVFNPTTKTCACPSGTIGQTSCASCSPSFINGPGFVYSSPWITNNCSQCATGYYPSTNTQTNLTLDVIDMSMTSNSIGTSSTLCRGSSFYISDTYDQTIVASFKTNNIATIVVSLYNDTSSTGVGPWTLAYQTGQLAYGSGNNILRTTVFNPGFQLERGKFYFICLIFPTLQGSNPYFYLNSKPVSTQPGLTYQTSGDITVSTGVSTLTSSSCTSFCAIYFIVPILTKATPLVCSTCEPSNVASPVYIANRFGPNCANICTCGAGGTCNTGLAGTGLCTCNSGYSGTGTTTCTPCNLGYAGSNCALCDGGTYANTTGMTSCLVCEAGKKSTAFGGSTGCVTCTPGYFSPAGANNCPECQNGLYTNTSGATVCIECEPGKQAPQYDTSTYCRDCFPGTYRYNSQLAWACQSCQPGLFQSESRSSSCNVCEIGKFTDGEGMTTCMNCDPGRYNNVNQSVTCYECDIGKYSSNIGLSMCTICSVGKVAVSQGMSQCTTCVAGKFSVDPTIPCVSCPTGSYSSANASQCIPCPVGTYANVTSTSACSSCPPGRISTSENTVNCAPCDAGKYSFSVTQCNNCQIGKYIDTTGNSACENCHMGRYQNTQGTTVCNLCEMGKYVDTTGVSICLDCIPGKFTAMLGHAYCTECPAGKFTGASGTINCTECSNGYFSNDIGFTACKGCNPGTYANHTGMTLCMLCDKGTYAPFNNSHNCTSCPTGFENFIPGAIECIKIPITDFIYSYEYQRNQSMNNETIRYLNKIDKVVAVFTLDMDYDMISDMDRFKGQFVVELGLLSNTSTSYIVINSVLKGSIILEVSMPLTSYNLILQFIGPEQQLLLDVDDFPILSRSSRVIFRELVSAQLDGKLYNTYYDLECRGRNQSDPVCMGIGSCVNGLCTCNNQDGYYTSNSAVSTRCFSGLMAKSKTRTLLLNKQIDACFSYLSRNSPDICGSYTGFTCESLGTSWSNIYPKRQYCQHTDYSIGSGPNRYTAIWGIPPGLEADYTRAPTDNSTHPVYLNPNIRNRTYPVRPSHSTIPYRVYNVFLVDPLTSEAAYLNPESTESVRYSGFAYVSNLFDGTSPVNAKVLSWIVANYMYDSTTLHLVHMTQLGNIEGDSMYIYDTKWKYKSCQQNEYVYKDITTGELQCECIKYSVRSLQTGMCAPGCINGYSGKTCAVVPGSVSCRLIWNEFTVLINTACTSMECISGYTPVMGICTAYASFGLTDSASSYTLYSASTSASGISTLQITLVVLGLIGGSLTILGTVYKMKDVYEKRRASARIRQINIVPRTDS